MAFPRQADVELALLRVLDSLGGEARPKDTYPLVAEHFPELTEEDRNERLQNSPSTRKWWNLVQWVRQHLVEKGEIDGSVRGVWKLAEAGKVRLNAVPGPRDSDATAQQATLRDLVFENLSEMKRRLVQELQALQSQAFESFCQKLLQELGFEDVHVTKQGADGGIDGYGDFRQRAVRIKSAFQAKKWQEGNSVGRPEIDKFRGAIQGDYDHGVFITTSRFTKEAQASSFKKGAITILLLDGDAVAQLMVERGIGVNKEPIYLLDLEPEFFVFDE